MWMKWLKKHAVNLVILTVIGALYAFTMVPQARTVFYEQEDQPIYQVAEIPYAAIQCNVYQGAEYIPAMLEILRTHDATITWNLGGLFVEDHPDLVRDMLSAGHELGNHGYQHLQHSQISYEDNVQEIKLCHELVARCTGTAMQVFAPPSGDYSDVTLQAARDLGYTTFMWSADTIDWRDQDVNLILSRVRENMNDGGILLIHPTAATLQALPEILSILQEEKNLEVVSLGELYAMSQEL